MVYLVHVFLGTACRRRSVKSTGDNALFTHNRSRRSEGVHNLTLYEVKNNMSGSSICRTYHWSVIEVFNQDE